MSLDAKRAVVSDRRSSAVIGLMLGLCALLHSCGMESRCYSDADCPSRQICDGQKGKCLDMCRDDRDCPGGYRCTIETGRCRKIECGQDSDCREGLECRDGRCNPINADFCLRDANPASPTFNTERHLSDMKGKVVCLYFAEFG